MLVYLHFKNITFQIFAIFKQEFCKKDVEKTRRSQEARTNIDAMDLRQFYEWIQDMRIHNTQTLLQIHRYA